MSILNKLVRALVRATNASLEPGAWPVLFVLGAVILNLIGNAAYEAVKNLLGTPVSVFWMALGVFSVLILVYALAPAIVRLFRRSVVVADIKPRQGLIVLVSQGITENIPANAAIEYHLPNLQHLWLVTTRQPQPSGSVTPVQPVQAATDPAAKPSVQRERSAYDNATALRDRFNGYKGQVVAEIREVERDDPKSVFRVVDAAFRDARRLKMRPDQVVADFTGGTKPMTVGMVLACSSANRHLEYLRPNRYLSDGRADPPAGSQPKRVDLSFNPVSDGEES